MERKRVGQKLTKMERKDQRLGKGDFVRGGNAWANEKYLNLNYLSAF